MRRFRLKPAHILWFERILHKMDVTIVNPICARLAQPGHDAQVSIETSTTVALDCCLSDVQDGGAVDAPPIWGDLRRFRMNPAHLMVRAHQPSHELRWVFFQITAFYLNTNKKNLHNWWCDSRSQKFAKKSSFWHCAGPVPCPLGSCQNVEKRE